MRRREIVIGLAISPLMVPVHAQESVPLVGVLSPASQDGAEMSIVNQPFKRALADLGYTLGRNIEIVERFANGNERRLQPLATELVNLQPRVLFTNTNAGAVAVAAATRSIPIVVGPAGEVVLYELAGGSLARPRTNVTGVVLTSPEIDAKCLSLLIEIAPAVRRIGILVNPRNPGQREYPAALSRAGKLDATLVRLEAGGLADIDIALAQALSENVDALFVADDPRIAVDLPVRQRVLRFATENRKPVISSHQNYARAGALFAMGPSIPALAARGAAYVDKILKGVRVEDLPIERPSTFITVVNVKTATALGLSIPVAILASADEVIE
jgi:putative tryptophan/tyrosine transport system substrate-binding protein